MFNKFRYKVRGTMNRIEGKPRILVVTFFLAAVFSGCDFQNISMTDYYKDHAATAAVLDFTMISDPLSEPGTTPILIPPGSTASMELTLDNERNLDLRLTLTGNRRIDNVSLMKRGPKKVLVEIQAPALGELYTLTLEIQDPHGLRTFAPYRFPPIKCTSAAVAMNVAVLGQLLDGQVVYDHDPDIDYNLWTLPGPPLNAVTPTITLAPGATLKVGLSDYDTNSPYPLDFTNGPLTFTVTADSGYHSQVYVVSVRHVQASRGTGDAGRYYPDLAGAVSAATSGTSLASPDTITVLANITQTGPLAIAAGNHVKFTVPVNENKTISLGTGHTGSLFDVPPGASLTLAGLLAVNGNKTGFTLDSPLITVNGGTVKLESGAKLQDAKRASGGIIQVTGGEFIMSGSSSITGMESPGGAVRVGGGTFTMNGTAAIQGNTGHGVYIQSGTFTMAGTISGNTAAGGAVRVDGGAFTMNGTAAIQGNTGHGVYIQSGTFIMGGGTISGNTAGGNGGGVHVAGGTFTMNGGTISGNTAAGGNGDGVYLAAGTFNISGGAVVNADNDVCLNGGKTLTVIGDLTSTPAAVIKPTVTVNGAPVLGGNTELVSDNYGKFALDPALSGLRIGSDGKLIDPSTGAGTLDMLKLPQGTAGSPVTVVMPESAVVNAPVVIPSGSFVELVPPPGLDITIERGPGNTGELFTVGLGAELYFGNSSDGTGSLVIDGNTQTGSSLITVNLGGKLVLDGDKVTIKGGSTTGQGGAVNVSGNGSVFDMSAGTIKGNASATPNDEQGGGAVYIGSGAAFNMSGGIIGGTSAADKNSAKTGGAVLVDGGGEFTMSGNATIAYNEATTRAGGVQVNNGTFTMKGTAVIERNTRLTTDMNHGYAKNGGGVVLTGSAAKFYLQESAEIRFNSAPGGAGVLIFVGGSSEPAAIQFFMNGGRIHHNTAESDGGGIWLDEGSCAQMTGGTIDNNTQTSSTDGSGGGGVRVHWWAKLLINSPAVKGSIHDNTAARNSSTPDVSLDSNGFFKVNNVDTAAY